VSDDGRAADGNTTTSTTALTEPVHHHLYHLDINLDLDLDLNLNLNMHRRGATTLPPLLAAAALLLLGGAHAADYCDGAGGLTQTQLDSSDPSCKGYCHGRNGDDGCSAAQVAAAMAARPADRDVQSNGCLVLGLLPYHDGASAAADAAHRRAVTRAEGRIVATDRPREYRQEAAAWRRGASRWWFENLDRFCACGRTAYSSLHV